tara:strand:+ start:7514 stop:7945 length:432 start_codon:yes stop_codon:yes gene_type:complete
MALSQAEAGKYSTIAAGCVADDNAIQGNTYDTGGHGVFARYQKTVRLICNVQDPSSLQGYIYLYFRSTVADGTVTAKLKSAAFGSTSTTTHTTCSSGGGGGSYDSCYMFSSPDADSRHYWFEVTIARTNFTTANPEFLGIRTQ